MPNRLAGEISPYLLQHAENPVDWQPWDAAALEQARRENKPIFLSIGYSACHWCHVMAHESFENDRIAETLREGFVCIKVDREERPEIDQIYMEAVQAMTGHGGWPLSVFLTPELLPFYGGTYWPARMSRGMPGFDQVLSSVRAAWCARRSEVDTQAQKVAHYLIENELDGQCGGDRVLDERPLDSAAAALQQSFDSRFGGFGGAPKFPAATALELLIRRWRRTHDDELRTIVTTTLDHMAAGGIYDHLGGGFHRYAVDARWLVPHFEKMLYDNAMLAACYATAFRAFGGDDYAQIARATLDYALRDMTNAACGFFASEDADSEGEEGKFYLWTIDEARSVLEPELAADFCRAYDVSADGNFEGRNILHRSRPLDAVAQGLGREPIAFAAAMKRARERLLEVRNRRVRPSRDDKILVNWNALMIDALARAGALLDEPRYLDAAARAAEFIASRLHDADGRLRHCWRNDQTRGAALLDDYAGLGNALVTLHESRGEGKWLSEAARIGDQILSRFAAPEGGFFYTAHDHEKLIARKRDMLDTPTPSGNGLAATLFVRLGRHTGRDEFLTAARETLAFYGGLMRQLPTGMGQLLLALDLWLNKDGDATAA